MLDSDANLHLQGVDTSDRYPPPHKTPHSLPEEVVFHTKNLTFTILSGVALGDWRCHSVQYYAMIYLAQAWVSLVLKTFPCTPQK